MSQTSIDYDLLNKSHLSNYERDLKEILDDTIAMAINPLIKEYKDKTKNLNKNKHKIFKYTYFMTHSDYPKQWQSEIYEILNPSRSEDVLKSGLKAVIKTMEIENETIQAELANLISSEKLLHEIKCMLYVKMDSYRGAYPYTDLICDGMHTTGTANHYFKGQIPKYQDELKSISVQQLKINQKLTEDFKRKHPSNKTYLV